ncbi:MAG: [LysW]-lysine hydrolase [Chloroflexota bacterium]|nr:[LysW]-lysine hydrolase [Chloroflexota bacterium]
MSHPIDAGTRIAETIPAFSAESLLCDLVATDSPSGDESRAVAHLVDWMGAHGATRATRDAAGNAIGEFGTGARQIVLLGHIDTFGAALPVHTDGRVLHGRGAVDAKGSLCAFAAAAAIAHADGTIPTDARVIVIGAVEEESASSKGAHYAVRQYAPSACLIGEPSSWDRITLGYKGRLIARWTWRGGLAHSAGQIASPGDRAVAFCNRVRAWVDRHNAGIERVFGRIDATVQAIYSGSDGVVGWSDVTIGLRLPPGVMPESAAELIAALTEDGTVTCSGHERAIVADKDTTVTRALRGAIREQGGTPAFVHKTGTSDMNIVGRLWDCPIAAYGAGDSALDHTPEERIDLDEYVRAVRVLASAIPRL